MSEHEPAVTVAEFKKRLAAICLKQGSVGLPRKRRDQHVLAKSITLTLSCETAYTEAELNSRLTDWLDRVGHAMQIDHVTLRRYLVDEGYVMRDRAGESYRVQRQARSNMFDSAIDDIDPIAAIDEAVNQRNERKRRYLTSQQPADK
ncbi:MAG: DUF2087 domain-containing protein [bacterium]